MHRESVHMIEIPFDIPSFNHKVHAETFCWPTIYSEYNFISYGLIDGALKVLEAQQDDVHIALTCKLSDIIIDLGNVMRQALDIQNAENYGHKIIYKKEYSPTLDWLLNSADPNDRRIINRLNSCLRDNFLKSSLVLQARKMKRCLRRNYGSDHYNAINYNLLMKEWIDSENIGTFNLLTEGYVHGLPHVDKIHTQSVVSAFKELIFDAYTYTPQLKKAVSIAIGMIVEYHLSQALGDLAHLKSSSLHKSLRNGLISGTPKYEGRMLSWYFCENNKDVIRFAHGGERVFYEDYAWPIAELPYCTHYYAHSQIEAKNMKKRIENGKYASMKDMAHIEFLSNGSKKHQALYQTSVKTEKNKKLVYVASVYEHDSSPGLPAFKTPDILYYEYQIRLIKHLKEQGWHIILKPHPKGIYQDQNYLAQYVDEIVKIPFDPNSFKAEIFLFDFAGTAFFDTLATTQRVVLLNLGGRPIDPDERKNLQNRCSVLDIGFDYNNLISFDKLDIRTSVN